MFIYKVVEPTDTIRLTDILDMDAGQSVFHHKASTAFR
ncbi:hypothetical protein PST407_05388 [Pseudomonas syringae pv. tomato]|uniref:Uncharacterized protein n=1 Tax=Pseudomonas syringae pv. tomato TaxID=323 RepID=A0AAV1BM98_PSEUB|nr:hypothetical protein PLA106_05774 [Pseudomonas amygdali pv. lachrymans str. M302278]KPB77580.1 Uncharacterized protein AC505_4682 [Pseudomonas syringae pv. maculicola]KPC11830.1 Uncharacterized protein AC500_2969 [Pseudomonas amygdali pv. lachrymans]KUR39721.1 hypothetical protein PSTA9_04692 [Pseudomonas syringae pv. tomato]RMM15221.1 hypothetical protein ALQ85_101612 [Pseudomonas syringae]